MHRFYLPAERCRGDLLTLEGREAHHALDVLRIRTGERVIILNGSGGEFFCEVIAANRRQLQLAVQEKRDIPPPPCRITLAQALPKGKLFESIVQKATELGVSQIVPLLSERVIVQLDAKDRENKRQKWQAIAMEAVKQCGSPWLPHVSSPLTPQQLVQKANTFECAIVGSLQPGARHPRECFNEFLCKFARAPSSACIWIGPEGDFTLEEVDLIQKSGACPVTLGPLVLRTETAALYCLSILNYEFRFPSNA